MTHLIFSSIHFILPEFLHHLVGGLSIYHTARVGAFVLYVNMILSFIICGYNRLSRLICQKLVTFCDQNIYYCSFLFPKATRYQLEPFSKETRRILFYLEIAKWKQVWNYAVIMLLVFLKISLLRLYYSKSFKTALIPQHYYKYNFLSTWATKSCSGFCHVRFFTYLSAAKQTR